MVRNQRKNPQRLTQSAGPPGLKKFAVLAGIIILLIPLLYGFGIRSLFAWTIGLGLFVVGNAAYQAIEKKKKEADDAKKKEEAEKERVEKEKKAKKEQEEKEEKLLMEKFIKVLDQMRATGGAR